MRVALNVLYDGSKFYGLQEQPDKNKQTIISTMHEACVRLKIPSKPVASGRTDAGVHSLGMIMHLDIPPYWERCIQKLHAQLNHHLAPYIYISKIFKANDNFHARFDAKKRSYRYILYHGKYLPFLHNYVLNYKAISLPIIQKAIKNFEGEHTFSFFKKNGTLTKDDIRKITKAYVYKHGEFSIFYFEGNGFLRAQIRLMVQSLLDIEEGKTTIEQLKEQIDGKKRYTNNLVFPGGLYFSKVFYDKKLELLSYMPKNRYIEY